MIAALVTAAALAGAESAVSATVPAEPAATRTASGGLVPLALELPRPAFLGTPKNIPPGTTVEPPSAKSRPPLLVPAGVVNLARGRRVTASVREPVIGDLAMVTDGDKEAADGSYVELGRGPQWIQIDLGKPAALAAVVVWHYHGDPRVFHAVAVQVSPDRDFIAARTLFNNDAGNALGLGAGKDREYFETYEGKLIEAGGVTARFVRLWTDGSTADEMNRYTEVEVYGRPSP